ETNLVLWRKIDQFDPRKPFLPWAFSIARFQVLANLRDRKRDRMLLDSELVESLSGEAEAMAGQIDSIREALGRCLQTLSSTNRQLIQRRYFEAKSLDEMAEDSNRSSGAIKVAKRMNNEFTELESLLMEWEAGTLSDAETTRLQAILKESPEARNSYLQWQALSAAFDVESHAVPSSDIDLIGHSLPVSRNRFVVKTWATFATFSLAASILVAALITWSIFSSGNGSGDKHAPIANQNPGTERKPAREVTSQGVALLTRLVDPAWPNSNATQQVGDALNPGPFRLDRGIAQIEFFCGATIVLEGPADIELQSSKQAR
ncbi:unnamed protein product, partial [Symbiodinium microadriaticum]